MKKAEIIKELNISFDKLLHLMKKHENHKFSEVLIEGKWTAGQHVEHLRMSTSPINTLMKLPKFILRYKWGVCNRPERNFEELVNKFEAKLISKVASVCVCEDMLIGLLRRARSIICYSLGVRTTIYY